MKLSEIPFFQPVTVLSLRCSPQYRAKLSVFGIYPGAKIAVWATSLGKTCYLIYADGVTFGLRRDEAEKIEVAA